jgi:hypothetical protein
MSDEKILHFQIRKLLQMETLLIDKHRGCASYNANLTSALTQCGGATYGYITGAAPKYAFCR